MFGDEILFIDLETTGQQTHKHRIIQIAAEFWQLGKLVKSFNIKFTPDICSIDINALKINHTLTELITNENYKHLNEKSALLQLVDFLTTLGNKSKIIMGGHKTAFDLRFLRKALSDNDIDGWDEFFSWDIIDTSLMAQLLIRKNKINLTKVSLKELANYFNIDFPISDQHDAMRDIAITAKLYYKLLELI